MLFDTHTHLNDAKFDTDRDAVLERARAEGIGLIVEIADAPDEWDKALALSRARSGLVRCALGLHPYYADQYSDRLGEELIRKAKLPEVIAVGEVGLDYARCEIPKETQKTSLKKMCEAAREAALPVVIHCRDAYEDLMPFLEEFYAEEKPAGRFHGVLHCFAGSADDALDAVGLGFALGVDGPVTYPKNTDLRTALYTAGLENLVLETDSPYLPPQSSRGKRNEPRAVREIAGQLAEIFNKKAEEVAALTTQNARDLFRLSEDCFS